MRNRSVRANTPQAASLNIVLAVTLWLGGCSGTPSVYPSEASHPAKAMTPGRIVADIDSLATVLPLTFDALHWGTVRVVNEVTALHAAALTEDDRPVEVRAQYTPEGLDVQVKVGYFGDKQAEQRLLEEVAVQLDRFRDRQQRKAQL